MLTIFMIAFSTSFVNAQTKQTTKKDTSSRTVHTKKDGTLDKRYKENKTTETTIGPLKKDGTADMRYKANKTKATSTTTKKKVQ